MVKIIQTPFVALDYLTNGNPENLTPQQIKVADDWAKDWEIISVEEFMDNETLAHRLTKSLINDMDFEDDENDDYG